MMRAKRIVRLNPSETKTAMRGVRGFLKNGAVSPKALTAFSKFLRTERGQAWAREHLTPTRVKKGTRQ